MPNQKSRSNQQRRRNLLRSPTIYCEQHSNVVPIFVHDPDLVFGNSLGRLIPKQVEKPAASAPILPRFHSYDQMPQSHLHCEQQCIYTGFGSSCLVLLQISVLDSYLYVCARTHVSTMHTEAVLGNILRRYQGKTWKWEGTILDKKFLFLAW